MNKDLVLKIAAAISADPNTYDPWQWCGTAYCLAGHACALAEDGKHADGLMTKGEDSYTNEKWIELFGQDGICWYSAPARKFLDIPEGLARRIFDDRWEPVPPLTVPEALRQWAETGSPNGCMIPVQQPWR